MIGWTICLSASIHGLASTHQIKEPCQSQWEVDWKSFLLIKAYGAVPCSLSMKDTPISQTIKGNVSNIDYLVTRQCSPDNPWVLASLLIPNTIDGNGNPPPRKTMSPATTKTAQEQLQGQTKNLRRHPDLQIPQISIRSSICGRCSNKSDPWRPQPPAYWTQRIHYKCPSARH